MASKFNPIKPESGDKASRRVIWTTESINMALDGMNKGQKLTAKPFFDNETKLLKADLLYQRTPEEVEHFRACAKDIILFCKECQLMTPEGVQNVTLRDYQEDYLRHLQENRLSIFLSCRQSGKCFSPLTRVKIGIKSQELIKKFNKFKIDEYYEIPVYEIYNYLNKKTIINKIWYWCYKCLDLLD